jgi:hypothetical protein
MADLHSPRVVVQLCVGVGREALPRERYITNLSNFLAVKCPSLWLTGDTMKPVAQAGSISKQNCKT